MILTSLDPQTMHCILMKTQQITMQSKLRIPMTRLTTNWTWCLQTQKKLELSPRSHLLCTTLKATQTAFPRLWTSFRLSEPAKRSSLVLIPTESTTRRTCATTATTDEARARWLGPAATRTSRTTQPASVRTATWQSTTWRESRNCSPSKRTSNLNMQPTPMKTALSQLPRWLSSANEQY